MNSAHKRLIGVAVAALTVAAAFAQPASRPGPGGGPGMMRMGPGNTAGWEMMSKQERAEHHNKMQTMKTHEECVAYMSQHHALMAGRAKERGRAAPGAPRRDGCAWLKK